MAKVNKIKTVIKIEKDSFLKDTQQARHDFAIVTGKPMKLKPAVFLHGKDRYCNIIGGMAYPTSALPGIIIIMGIQNDPVKFRVLDVFENDNVFSLIKYCIDMREKWGYDLDRRILPWWYGDQEKFQVLIIKASEILERKLGHDRGIYVKDLADLRERHAFPLYLRQLFAARESGRFEAPSESGFMNLVGYIQGFDKELAEKTRVEDYPAVGLLSGMIHSLQVERPWEEEVIQGEAFNIE